MQRAIFLDRDGVICQNRVDHVKSWQEFSFLPGSLEALARLATLGLPVIVVTNQAIVNRGMVPREVVEDIHTRMLWYVEQAGGRIDRVLYCPHRPDEHCHCRKPNPGLLLAAANDLAIDVAQSYLVGDAESDLQAGLAVGCKSYLTLTGRGWQQLIRCWLHGIRGVQVVADLSAAVNSIARCEATRRIRATYLRPVTYYHNRYELSDVQRLEGF